MERRGFLRAMLAVGAAPAIVRASSLMKMPPRFAVLESGIVAPSGNRIMTITEITNDALRAIGEFNAACIAPMSGIFLSQSSLGLYRIGDRITIEGVV